MKALQILLHSIRMVFGNIQPLIQLVWLPVGLYIPLAVYISQQFTPILMGAATVEDIAMVVLAFLGSVLLFVWAVVNWHRFVLLEEYPSGWVNLPDMSRVLPYIGMSILLSILAFLVMMCAGFVSGFLRVLVSDLAAITILVIGAMITLVVFMRCSLVLPAAAIGQKLSVVQAWAKTRGATGVFFLVIVISMAANVAFEYGVSVPLAGAPSVQFALSVLWQMLVAGINVSVLTTLYGHFVEGRPLSE